MTFESKFVFNYDDVKNLLHKIYISDNIHSMVILYMMFLLFTIYYTLCKDLRLVFLIIFILVSTTIIYIKSPIKALEKIKKLNKICGIDEGSFSTVIFNDYIVSKDGRNTLSFTYDSIVKFYRFDKFSALILSDNLSWIIFCEDKFVEGTKEEFEKFIFDKCPKLKKIEYV